MVQYITRIGRNITLISFYCICFQSYSQETVEAVIGEYMALGYDVKKELILKKDGFFLERGKVGLKRLDLNGNWKLNGSRLKLRYNIPKKGAKSLYQETNCSKYPLSDSVNIFLYDDLLRPISEYDSIGYYNFLGNRKFIYKSNCNGFYILKDSIPNSTAFFFQNHERLNLRYKGSNCLHMFLKRDISYRFKSKTYNFKKDSLVNTKYLPYVKVK